MAKYTKAYKKTFDRRSLKALIALSVVVGGSFLFIIFPELNARIQFFIVLNYVKQDSLSTEPITYTQPTINRSSLSISEHHWWHHNHLDWGQVNAFLNTLEGEGRHVQWCEYYNIDPEHYGPAFKWLIWFQTIDGDYKFLYYYDREYYNRISATITKTIFLIAAPILIIATIFWLAQVKSQSESRQYYSSKFVS